LLERDTFDLFLPEFDKPWVIHLRETCCYSTNIKLFSGAVAGEKDDFCKGSLSLPIFYFVIVLFYFILACIFLLKIQKKLVPLIVGIPLLLLLVHYVVP
jgi:hypothetical protein